MKAFLTGHSERAQQSLDLAYTDVRAAFQYYLAHENHGRPIIIASHSQGSLHAIRLLKEFFDGKPLGKQLVCAYVIGHRIGKDAFAQLPLCRSPSATGCFVGWRSFRKGTIPPEVKEENGNSVCVNPLTWSVEQPAAGADPNHGALIAGFNPITPHFAGAGVEPASQILWVTMPAGAPDRVSKLKNLHVFDYNLFWVNIRENAQQRVNSFLSTKGVLR
ncbi:MAG: DUF3089 domain-containing protein [Bacteroidota bacterium]|nr:DUF3089 domain-containing protein [Bacteroidota bacterium]